ncbi:hypothetical protein [Clostridium sp. MD294]|nr:hypothetical protein [Clostridium sp. MD294]
MTRDYTNKKVEINILELKLVPAEKQKSVINEIIISMLLYIF